MGRGRPGLARRARRLIVKYYEGHDAEYQRRLGAGQVAWDPGSYEAFITRPFLECMIAASGFDPAGKQILVLGCGTGPAAVWLAKLGGRVTGIDISKTAIEAARAQAAARSLSVDFVVADCCATGLAAEAYDLIVDDHFLHCLVKDDERRFVLENVRRALGRQGEFWLQTMVGHPAMIPDPDWLLDGEGVTWSIVPASARTEDCIEREGRILFPVRRIQPCAEQLVSELRAAKLEILWSETEPPARRHDTGTFRARCRRGG